MSDREWHDITRYNLVMPQKSMIKLYNIKSISHHYTTDSSKYTELQLQQHYKNYQAPKTRIENENEVGTVEK